MGIIIDLGREGFSCPALEDSLLPKDEINPYSNFDPKNPKEREKAFNAGKVRAIAATNRVRELASAIHSEDAERASALIRMENGKWLYIMATESLMRALYGAKYIVCCQSPNVEKIVIPLSAEKGCGFRILERPPFGDLTPEPDKLSFAKMKEMPAIDFTHGKATISSRPSGRFDPALEDALCECPVPKELVLGENSIAFGEKSFPLDYFLKELKDGLDNCGYLPMREGWFIQTEILAKLDDVLPDTALAEIVKNERTLPWISEYENQYVLIRHGVNGIIPKDAKKRDKAWLRVDLGGIPEGPLKNLSEETGIPALIPRNCNPAFNDGRWKQRAQDWDQAMKWALLSTPIDNGGKKMTALQLYRSMGCELPKGDREECHREQGSKRDALLPYRREIIFPGVSPYAIQKMIMIMEEGGKWDKKLRQDMPELFARPENPRTMADLQRKLDAGEAEPATPRMTGRKWPSLDWD